MTDIEKRAHDLAVAYTVEYFKTKGLNFEADKSKPFEFGNAYEHIYDAILKSLEEKNRF